MTTRKKNADNRVVAKEGTKMQGEGKRDTHHAFVRFGTPGAVAANDAVHHVLGYGHERDLHINVRLCRRLEKFNLKAAAFRAGKKDGGKESVAHLILVRKQLPPRVFDLSFLDHVGLVA